MKNNEYFNNLITEFSGRNNMIVIPRLYVDLLDGDLNNAMLLNQIIYWSDRTKRKDGFFFKTYPEWNEELGLSEYQVRHGIKKFESLGWVETKLKKANGSPTKHYRFVSEVFQETILKLFQNRSLNNLSIQPKEIKESLTEITTEITTETTTNKNSASDNAQESQLINEFNEWWELYDKKKDRKAAFTKFKTARKKHSFEQIINGTKEYLKTINNKQFQKYPKTFLHNESYLEDYSDSYVDAEPLTGNVFNELRNEFQ